MGILDAILEGIGNVLLVIVGIIIFLAGIFIFPSNNIIGFVLVIIGLGMIAAKYRRQ